jgi:hypothetical protein
MRVGWLDSATAQVRNQAMRTARKIGVAACGLLLFAFAALAQKHDAPPLPPPASAPQAEFLQAADEVLAQMSKLLALPVLQPLKKSVRSREEIRDYLVASMKDDKDDVKRHADQRALEALGLIPKGYPLDQKLLALLTEQIAGMYDPKGREFFIADWTSPADQKMIMAHELTHALEDQHFHVEKWEDAAKPNDDDELARDAVLEGSATLSMFDYQLQQLGRKPGDIFELDPSLLLSLMFGDLDKSPELADSPQVLRDEMLFPYGAGATFNLQVLRANGGWAGIHKMFERPPASTQQIIHPDLYLKGVMPVAVTLPNFEKIVPRGFKKLDENLLGEFGLGEVLKQFLGKERADDLSSSWAGDKYAIFENKPGGPTILAVRMRLATEEEAARMFGAYSEVLEQKDSDHTNLVRRPNFFSFDTSDGGVFLRCYASECFTAEGVTREVFDAMTHAMNWPDAPAKDEEKPGIVVRGRPPLGAGTGAAALIPVLPQPDSIPLR